MLEEILGAALDLDETALRRFRRYYELLTEWNKVMNLTAIEGEENTARLHFLDCAALTQMVDLRGKRVIDVGTGAGFPGLVLKILCPEMELTLLDSLDKRVRFLSTVCDELGFSEVRCLHARAEEAPPELREAEKGIRLLGGETERVAEYPVPGTEVRHNAVLIRKIAPTPEKYPRKWSLMKKQPL